jgi:hypothetical protein
MQVYPCSHCGHLVFFDSMHCVRCGSTLAFVPEAMALRALEPTPGQAPALWQARSPAPGAARYRLCTHRDDGGGCNFALPAHSPHHLCPACRQTHMLPPLADPLLRQHWARIEAAKRQLFYTLARLGLQGTADNADAQDSPRYALLADLTDGPAILTGHHGGTITLNVAEADDGERAQRRVALGEPYRTLIGHLRHESGHFYWDQLVRDGGRLEAFRSPVWRRAPGLRRRLERPLRRGQRPGRLAPAPCQQLRRVAPLGRLGRNLGALPAHGGPAGNRGQLPHQRDRARPERCPARPGDRPLRQPAPVVRHHGAPVGAADAAAQQPEPQPGSERRLPLRSGQSWRCRQSGPWPPCPSHQRRH